jgi:outer membrane autotransporter protein
MVINNYFFKFGLVSMVVFSTNIVAQGLDSFSRLQTNSEAFVRATCKGFQGGNNVQNAQQQDLFGACRSMVQSANELNGSGNTDFSRGLGTSALAGGYQNVVSEETFAPLTISAEASMGQYSSIAAHINKIRKGSSFALASFQPNWKSFDLAGTKQGNSWGSSGGEDDLLSSSRLGFFINTIGGFGETHRTERENGSDFHSIGVIAGIDYRVLDNLIVGIAGGYSHLNLDFAQSVDVGGGGVEADNYNISAYSTFYAGDFYVDGVFTYGWSDYEIERKILVASNTGVSAINRTAFATPEGEQFYGSLASGYNFHTGSLTYGPYIRMTYMNASIDSYKEHGAQGLDLRVADQEVDSLESVLGGQISYAFSQSFAVIVPHFRIEWHHEFFDSAREFSISYVNDPRNNTLTLESDRLDGDYFNIGVGVSADFKHGFQAFLDYETVLELKNVESHIFTAGLRMEF